MLKPERIVRTGFKICFGSGKLREKSVVFWYLGRKEATVLYLFSVFDTRFGEILISGTSASKSGIMWIVFSREKNIKLLFRRALSACHIFSQSDKWFVWFEKLKDYIHDHPYHFLCTRYFVKKNCYSIFIFLVGQKLQKSCQLHPTCLKIKNSVRQLFLWFKTHPGHFERKLFW